MTPRYQQILGVKFFNGDVEEAIAFMSRQGGFLVAPSVTCFSRLGDDTAYRKAMTNADLAIPDSGAMVLLWGILRGKKIARISGLKYLQRLLATLKGQGTSKIFWILPGERSRQNLLDWSRQQSFVIKIEDCYAAPQYRMEAEDRHLLAHIEKFRPDHVIIAIGSGPQEKLGYYLRENLSYRPVIHCTGAALGFVTGDQKPIPGWADRFYLGWFLRFIAQPRRFIPRLWNAHELPWLIWKYGESLPPLLREKGGR